MENKLTDLSFLRYRKGLLLIIMRTFIFLCCATVFALTPNNIISQNSKIIIEEDKTLTVDEVFDLIMNQTDYIFFYEEGLFDNFPKLRLKKGAIKTSRLLSKSLGKGNLDITVTDNGGIVIKEKLLRPIIKEKPQIQIIGSVTDINGAPLPGANIIEKGTTNGTQTDFDGKFLLKVDSEDATLVVSYLGFATKEIALNGQTQITIPLEEDAAALDEIVVVGYGTQKKESVTGSVSTVKSEELTRVPAANTTAVLAGRLPGLIVDQNNGRPGFDVANINIRGFGGALVIVDGVQRNFTQLDPNEIENITILKDAAAAVYGIQAQNGVILVTTKRGKVGKPVISYTSTYSQTENVRFPQFASIQEWEQAIQLNRDFIADPTGRGPLATEISDNITPERLARLRNGEDPGTNWLDVVTRDFAPLQQHNLNVRGGSEAVKYFISGGFLDQGTIWRSGDFGFERFNATSNLDVKISNNLSASLDLGWRREKRETEGAGNNSDFDDIALAHPGYPATLPEGRIPLAAAENAFSPIASTNADIGGVNADQRDILNGSFALKYNIPKVKGLSLESKVAILQSHINQKNLRRTFTLWGYDGTNFTLGLQGNGGVTELSEANSRFQRTTTQLSLRYARQFNNHNVSGLLLWERINERSDFLSGSGQGLLSPDVPFLFTSNADTRNVTSSASEFGREALVGRVNYDYKGKYLFEFSFRNDASPYFPEDTRVGFFPGVSIGWRISEEGFMSDSNFIHNLKLRASASQLGSDGANSFDYIEGFSINGTSRSYIFGGTFQTGITTLGSANPNITWQRSNLYNIGLDASFLKGKLGLELDVFYRKRFDILARDTQGVNLPSTVGDVVPFRNIESRNNRGFEAVVNYKGNIGDDLKLNVSGNVSWTREKFGKTIEQEEYDDPDLERIGRRSGQWVNRTFGYVFDGFYNTQEEIDNETLDYDLGGQDPSSPGDIRIRDINNDGIIDTRDRIVVGRNGTPEILFGLNTNLTWKNFDFTMFWQGAANFDRNITGHERFPQLNRTPFKYVTERVWSPENTANAEFPIDGNVSTNNQTLDKYFIDSKYVRLKNLVIGYSLPKDVLEKVGMKALRIYLSGTNLITIDGLGFYPWDPESGGRQTYPAQRVYSLGVNLSL